MMRKQEELPQGVVMKITYMEAVYCHYYQVEILDVMGELRHKEANGLEHLERNQTFAGTFF